ncbi:DUF861 domain-containing protein [Pseudomonas sp. TH39(2020)]|uniref:cupin domain-containing protein n=1 Tax=Pseudomonas sp. TH39(2020) TaxID=2796349 RepID=UPI001913AD51|nr:cupin domain-containing protein [Pseudomonas sp. TH39(2020)]MBK5396372.1 DUF861 domain-containing protein [Pseudomonas sp. TH39(2020)]
MITYSPSNKNDELVYIGSPEDLGAKTLSGSEIKLYARVDFGGGDLPLTTGLFEVTKGSFSFTYPFSELATLIEGELEITDESGNSVTYKGGDGRSWFISKGATVIWHVKSATARKSFFSATTDIDKRGTHQ